MYRLGDIVGKNVIGLYEAKSAGTLMGALLDRSLLRLRYFEVAPDDEGDANRLFFPPECVGALDGDAVMIRNCGKLVGRYSLPPSFVRGPMSAPVYSPDGRSLGRVTDLTLDGFTVTHINVGELAFPPECVLSRSDEMLIINDTGENIRLVPPAKKVPSPHGSSPAVEVRVHAEEVSAAYEGDVTRKNAPMPNRRVRGNAVELPARAAAATENGSFDFLLGRVATREIRDEHGKKIISAGEVIDGSVLGAALKADRLVSLALCSK